MLRGYMHWRFILGWTFRVLCLSPQLERPDASGLAPFPSLPGSGANGLPHLDDSIDGGTLDPRRSRRVVAQLRQKILKLTEQIKVEQAARDTNVAEYLELAHGAADRQQAARIKQAFEKKNQRSAQGLQQLQSKLERYHRRLCEAERSGTARQPNDPPLGLRDASARAAGGSSSQVTTTTKAKENALLIQDKFSSIDNIATLKDAPEESKVEEGAAAISPRPGPSYDSEDDCSSATSGSAGGADSTTGPKAYAQISAPGLAFETLLHEVREVRDAQGRLVESLENLKAHYHRDYTFIMQALQEERYRCEHLEEQLNDLSELHQNEIFILKQELASMEEKVAYQSYEQGRDVQEALEACQTRVFKMEQQQHVAQQEDPDRAAARTLLGKLVGALLVAMTTVADCLPPLLQTFGHSSCALCLLLLLLYSAVKSLLQIQYNTNLCK
uniref:Transmembrane and coiled-coil domain family 2 n=1 Tax=Paramormyrops kingsleyae TaxID=1676925 RepID=A0A3B3RLL0_9TELE